MGDVGEYFQKKERAEELSHGGLVSRDGDIVTLGDGSQWWLNGEQWARNSADATIIHDTINMSSLIVDERARAFKELGKRLLN